MEIYIYNFRFIGYPGSFLVNDMQIPLPSEVAKGKKKIAYISDDFKKIFFFIKWIKKKKIFNPMCYTGCDFITSHTGW